MYAHFESWTSFSLDFFSSVILKDVDIVDYCFFYIFEELEIAKLDILY